MPALEILSLLRKFPRFSMPSSPRFTAVLLTSCVLALVVGAQELPANGLYGEIKNGNYTANAGRFRVTVPVLAELGGKVFDTENVVTFTDEVSTHVSIASFPLDMSNKWEFETRGPKDFLAYFYAENVFTNFSRRFAGAANERSVYTDELKSGALFVFTLLPGGSAFQGKSTVVETADSPPPAAKRGTLLFVENGCVFIVSTELAERVTQRTAFQKTADEENEILRTRLIAIAGKLVIPAPRPPAKKIN